MVAAKGEAAVLRCSADVGAEKLRATDAEAARLLLAAREKQMLAVKKARDAAAKELRQRSRKASFENAGRLREMLEGAKGKLAAAAKTRDAIVDQISDLGTVYQA